MAAPTLTPDRLERNLRKRLLDPKTVIRMGHVKGSAGMVEWTPESDEKVAISVNTKWVGLVGTVIHELVHVELNGTLEPLGEYFEELCVTAIAESIEKRVYASPRRSRWWTRECSARARNVRPEA